MNVSGHDTNLALTRLYKTEKGHQKIDYLDEFWRLTLMIPGQLGPISLVLLCLTSLCFTWGEERERGGEKGGMEGVLGGRKGRSGGKS